MAQAKHTLMPAGDQGNTVTRRALITAAPVIALAAVLASGAEPEETQTPVMALYREWERLLSDAERYGVTGDDMADDRYWADVYDVEDRIFATPATDRGDMMIKICVATGFGQWGINHGKQIWAEARALVA